MPISYNLHLLANLQMGKPAARITDFHSCPMVTPGVPPIPHVGGPIIGPGCPTVLIGNLPAAVLGDNCVCAGPPDVTVMGSMGVLIGGKPALRMGDNTAHGGMIVGGFPTVLIGDSAAGGAPMAVQPETFVGELKAAATKGLPVLNPKQALAVSIISPQLALFMSLPNNVKSMVLDFIPIAGDIKGVIEGVLGFDILTGEELAGWERALGFLFLSEVKATKNLLKHADEVGDLSNIVKKSDVPIKGGKTRAMKYSKQWGNYSLKKVLNKFAPDITPKSTKSGKRIFHNSDTGIQVVEDVEGNYFRIQDTNIKGKRQYLDLEGNIPNNKTINGKTSGRNSAEYNEVTHFNNID